MNPTADVLWLSVSPYLKCFDQRLLSRLVKFSPIRRWEYCQTLDEPCSIDDVVASLDDYLTDIYSKTHRKTHLVGHGVSGIVALLYARRHPEKVASLTLLSVGAMPAINWQAHYYALRELLPCSRDRVLAQMARLLFGKQAPRFAVALAQLLANDLDGNLTLHSLAHRSTIPSGATEVPLLVCNGEHDPVIYSQKQSLWEDYLKEGDRLWICPEGNHFFHFKHYDAVVDTIVQHWHQVALNLFVNEADDSLKPTSEDSIETPLGNGKTSPKEEHSQNHQNNNDSSREVFTHL